MRDTVRTKNVEMRVIKWERVWNDDKEEEKNRKSKREREARIILPMVKIGFMQVHPTFKTCFIYLFYISFNLMIRFILMNCHFDCYDLKIYFMKCIWRWNGQNYSLAFKIWDSDDMQYNSSEIKWEVKNEVSTVTNLND